MEKDYCKLCGLYKNLCKESHIIPKFLNKYLKDNRGSFIYLKNSSHNAEQVRYNTEYDSNILCQQCEGLLGKYDDYSAKLILDKFKSRINFQFKNSGKIDYLILENSPYYKYAKFKLFLLSLLWRASISSRPFFKQVKLEESVEKDIGDMIYNQNPGDIYEYPCIIVLPPLEDSPYGKVFTLSNIGFTMAPYIYTIGDKKLCKFVIMGTHYVFLIDKNPKSLSFYCVDRERLLMIFGTPDRHRKLLDLMAEILRRKKK